MLIERVATLVEKARRICILTGAGVSAESGIATFRDAQEGKGLWADYDPQQLASLEGFLAEPERVWQWYQWRREVNKDKKPNPAHMAIAQLQEAAALSGKQDITLITQNVDGLHQKAGSKELIEIHGNLWNNHCLKCMEPYLDDVCDLQKVVNCQSCSGPIRPSVVWFGEGLDQKQWQAAETAAYCCDLFLSVGTSSQVYPAAGLAATAKSQGAIIVEINPHPTDSILLDYQIKEKAGVILPLLMAKKL